MFQQGGFIADTIVQDYVRFREKKGAPLAPLSVEQVEFAIKLLNEFIEEKGYGLRQVADAKRFHLERFIEWGREIKRWKDSTIGARLYNLRMFFEFCVVEGLVQSNPTTGLEAPEITPEETLIVTDNEWDMLLASVMFNGSGEYAERMAKRNIAALNTLAYTAATLDAITSLGLGDFDQTQSTLRFRDLERVHGRVVEIPIELRDQIVVHLETSRHQNNKSRTDYGDRLFDMGSHTFHRLISTHSQQAFGRSVSAEIIRASRIQALIDHGVLLQDLALFTGIHDLNRFWRFLPSPSTEDRCRLAMAHDSPKGWLPDQPGTYFRSFNKRKMGARLRRI